MIKILLSICVLFFSVLQSSDIKFSFNGQESSQPKQLVQSFALIKGLLEDYKDEKVVPLPNNVSKESFQQWISFSRTISVKNSSGNYFPRILSIPIRKKIISIVEQIPDDKFANFITAGEVLQVPQNILQYITKYFFNALLKKSNVGDQHIPNPFVSTALDTSLRPIKDMFLISSYVLKIKPSFFIPFKEYSLNDYFNYVFSKQGDYIAYMHIISQPGQPIRNTVCEFDLKDRKIKASSQQHAFDATNFGSGIGKSKQQFIRVAAKGSCFLTIHNDDDRILVHDIGKDGKKYVIALDKEKEKEWGDIECCDISADGDYVVIGYERGFVIYDQNGNIKNKHLQDDLDLKSGLCSCDPSDNNSAVLVAALLNRQYTPSISNNEVILPFAHYEQFLEKRFLENVFHSGSGEYIFTCDIVDKHINISRLRSLSVLQAIDTHIIPDTYDNTVRINQLQSNDEGSMAACIINIDVQGAPHKHKLFILDYVRNRIYNIPGDISSFAFDGYLLAYFKKDEQSNQQSITLHDALHNKELIRHKIPINQVRILGFTKRHELIIQAHTGFIFYNIGNDCLGSIEQFMNTFNFLKEESDWFSDLLILNKLILGKDNESFENWLDKAEAIFSKEFNTLLLDCDFPTMTKTLARMAKENEKLKQRPLSLLAQRSVLSGSSDFRPPQQQNPVIKQKTPDSRPIEFQQSVITSTQGQVTAQPPQPMQSTPSLVQRAFSAVNRAVDWIANTFVAPLFRLIGFVQ